jgi:hypothetical protein
MDYNDLIFTVLNRYIYKMKICFFNGRQKIQ